MSPLPDTNTQLQSDIIALLLASTELAEWDARWSETAKVFEGVTDCLAGPRNLGRLPFVEVGFPTVTHEPLTTSDYGGLLVLPLRCRLAPDHRGVENGAHVGEMFLRIWRTLELALCEGTANCPDLRGGAIAVSDAPEVNEDGRALVFDITLSWTAPLPH